MGCAGLPSLEGRPSSSALTDTQDTRLGRGVAPKVAAHPGKSGIYALPDPYNAYAARLVLAAAAEKSLDVQYYIWNGDETGYLLLGALWQAADRGVRVRLLLDDNGVAGLDEVLATVDAHPNIEVRLYNPFTIRSFRVLNYATDFSRLNHRMHNKSMTADNQAAIFGGRNIGNEYFAAGSGVWFRDLDALAVGPVVQEVSKAFDRYWNSDSAYPVAGLLPAPKPGAKDALLAKFKEVHAEPLSQTYIETLRKTELAREIEAGHVPFEWSSAELVVDDPAKTLDRSGRKDVLLLSQLFAAAGHTEHSFDLVSPYFVPGEEGTNEFVTAAARGLRIRVLTNSLEATDVGAVHAGYAKRRKDLLRAGVVLYELRPVESDDEKKRRVLGGSSGASLHAKTFALDGKRLFIGSFNFDQRSAELNTELGVLIDNRDLAQRLVEVFQNNVRTVAY
ncbi:MAG TPA: phospholipase D family protein, partial [Burkholderiales bacterium]|nr:phospholipase D family protein [Burkholderiales bacterium]